MLDLAYFRNNNSNVQIFYPAGSTSWQTWIKPRGAKFVNILCIGGGGGGGAASGNPGGGSGASAGHVKVIYQSSILPDILYVQPGLGGNAGINVVGSTTGGSGNISYVGIIPNASSAANLVCASSATSAGGGGAATAGTAATITTTANALFLNLGTFTAAAGIAGVVGNFTAVATNITPTIFLTPGANGGSAGSGAGTLRNGGNINAVGPVPLISGGIGTAVANGNGGPGRDGVLLYKPILICTGGAGGGNSCNATPGFGGNGGNGAYGCGGGGGGASLTNANGGNGGKGGDGIVIITTSF
jgi:hypothetical protein